MRNIGDTSYSLAMHSDDIPDGRKKLLAHTQITPFRVVLVEPEIPPNTGAVARTCVATRSPLHLVGRLGFRIDDRTVRRAGLDYWRHLQLDTHKRLEDFEAAHPTSRPHLFSSFGEKSYLEADFEPGDALVFGKESTGLDEATLARHTRVWGIPTWGEVRSLNLSNAVAIVLYEALRKAGALSTTSASQPPTRVR